MTQNFRPGNSNYEKVIKQLEKTLGSDEAAALMKEIYHKTMAYRDREMRLMCEAYGILL